MQQATRRSKKLVDQWRRTSPSPHTRTRQLRGRVSSSARTGGRAPTASMAQRAEGSHRPVTLRSRGRGGSPPTTASPWKASSSRACGTASSGSRASSPGTTFPVMLDGTEAWWSVSHYFKWVWLIVWDVSSSPTNPPLSQLLFLECFLGCLYGGPLSSQLNYGEARDGRLTIRRSGSQLFKINAVFMCSFCMRICAYVDGSSTAPGKLPYVCSYELDFHSHSME